MYEDTLKPGRLAQEPLRDVITTENAMVIEMHISRISDIYLREK